MAVVKVQGATPRSPRNKEQREQRGTVPQTSLENRGLFRSIVCRHKIDREERVSPFSAKRTLCRPNIVLSSRPFDHGVVTELSDMALSIPHPTATHMSFTPVSKAADPMTPSRAVSPGPLVHRYKIKSRGNCLQRQTKDASIVYHHRRTTLSCV